MKLNNLFPKSTKNKIRQKEDDLLYIILVEWGWDYETFLKTPIPIIMRILKAYNKIKKTEAKAYKKKR
jgi:hypothetical protein